MNYRFLKKFPKKWEIIRKIGNQKFIFIHVNKTGGTSISKGLKDPCINHFTVKEAITKMGEKSLRTVLHLLLFGTLSQN